MSNTPYNLHQAERIKQQAIREERERVQLNALANGVSEELGKDLALILFNMPYENWPQFAKEALRRIGARAPVCLSAYKQLKGDIT